MPYGFNVDKTKYDLSSQFIVVEGYKDVQASSEALVNYTEFVTDDFPEHFNDLILISAMIGVYQDDTGKISWTNRLVVNGYFYPELGFSGDVSNSNDMYLLIYNPKTAQNRTYYRLAFMVKE